LGRCLGRAAEIVPELIARIPSAREDQARAALILVMGSLAAALEKPAEISHALAVRAADEIVVQDDAFCSAVAESLRRTEGL